MSDQRILITLSSFCEFDETPRQLLRDSGLPFVENPSGKRMTPEEILAAGTDWTGLVAGVEPYQKPMLEQLSQLTCISRVGVGVDSIDLSEARARNITICNTPAPPVCAVAEMAMALLLCTLRRIGQLDGWMKNNTWKKATGSLLQGKTVGLIGTGRIGKAMAERLLPFGVKLVGYDVAPDEAWAKQAGLAYLPLNEVVTVSDIISVHAAPGAGEPAILGSAEIAKMKPGACLLNTARGHSVDADALAEALQNGHLSGAGLDVYPEEPYEGPLQDLENVTLTPHVATLTRETRVQMEMQAVENLLAVLTGKGEAIIVPC